MSRVWRSVRPGSPFVYGGFTSNVDMKSGAPAFGGDPRAFGGEELGDVDTHCARSMPPAFEVGGLHLRPFQELAPGA